MTDICLLQLGKRMRFQYICFSPFTDSEKIKKKVQGSLNAVKLQIIRNKAWKYLNNEKWDTAEMPM